MSDVIGYHDFKGTGLSEEILASDKNLIEQSITLDAGCRDLATDTTTDLRRGLGSTVCRRAAAAVPGARAAAVRVFAGSVVCVAGRQGQQGAARDGARGAGRRDTAG